MTWPTITFTRQDDAVAGQARGAAAAARPRPHQGRHRRLAAAGTHAASAATWSSSTPRRMPATPTSRTGRRRSTTSPRSKPAALVPGPRRRRCTARSRSRRAWPARAPSSPTCTPACKAGVGGRQGPERGLQGHLREAEAEVRPLGHLRPLHAVRRHALPTTRRRSTPTRASGRPSATSRCGRRWKAEPRLHADAADGTPPVADASRRRDVESRLPGARVRLPRARADQDARAPVRHPVVVVGAGPVGLALAIDLAQRGQPRAAARQRRHGCRPARARSASPSARSRSSTASAAASAWSTRACRGTSARSSSATSRSTASTCCPSPATSGRRSSTCSSTTSRATSPSARPSCRNSSCAGRTRSSASSSTTTASTLSVETPDGRYALRRRLRRRLRRLRAPACASCSGWRARAASSSDRFLIADVKIERCRRRRPSAGSGSTRRSIRTRACCCTASPTTSGASTSSSAGTPTPRKRRSPRTSSRACRRCCAHSPTKDAEFELEWASVYTFACLRMERFRHGRVLFAGDSAHGVSPFGARGANSGVQDAENLAWKLAAVLRGAGARRAARQLCRRARIRGRREHPQLDARHRLHHAEERDQPPVPRRGAGAGARRSRSRARWSTAAACRCRRRCATRR